MASQKEPVLVVINLSGGNDFMNTIVPYTDSRYQDYRPHLGISEDEVLRIDDRYGFNPNMGPIKDLYDQGKVAVIMGTGYPNPSRSHFRSQDIWQTCEADKISNEGWLGRALADIDPKGENVLTGVNFGRGLPRAMAKTGVPVASVGNLESYGVLTGITGQEERAKALEVFSRMYAPAIGAGPVLDYLWQTGQDALKGADILKTVPGQYKSDVEFGSDPTGQGMRSISMVHLADLGTRIFMTTTPYNLFDTHANQADPHSMLWRNISRAVTDFYADVTPNDHNQEILIVMFTEFGRRVRDNGTGTDHGTGGGVIIIGDSVKGGLYGEYPSLDQAKLEDGGDLQHTVDFRSVYSTVIDKWMGLDPVSVIGGNFEQLNFL